MCKALEALEALKASDAVTITAEQAAPVLGCKAHSLRLQAEEDPAALGFNASRIGNRLVIPRLPFIKFVEGA